MSTPALTPHFTWAEVERSATADRLGIVNWVPPELHRNIGFTARMMEEVRLLLGGRPLRVNSWYRCTALNAAIGGSKTSAHMQGLAVDFEQPGTRNELVFHQLAVSGLPFDQLIHERTRDGADWIHLGFAPEGREPRRQVLRATGDALGGKMTFTRVAVG